MFEIVGCFREPFEHDLPGLGWKAIVSDYVAFVDPGGLGGDALGGKGLEFGLDSVFAAGVHHLHGEIDEAGEQGLAAGQFGGESLGGDADDALADKSVSKATKEPVVERLPVSRVGEEGDEDTEGGVAEEVDNDAKTETDGIPTAPELVAARGLGDETSKKGDDPCGDNRRPHWRNSTLSWLRMTEPTPSGTPYAGAVRRLMLALVAGTEPESDDMKVILLHLEDELTRRFESLSVADRNDVIGDTFTAFVGAVQEGKVSLGAEPGGYLWRTAERRALDRLRRPAELPLDEGSPPIHEAEDDTIAARLDERACASDVDLAMGLGRADNNHRVNRTVSEWLVLAQRNGKAPSTREVAEVMGVSHDTVARHLKIFREYLERILDRTG
jgi:DNA-directed RNA polymerase specialized sigma24 family protein